MAQTDHVPVRISPLPRLSRLLLRGDPAALGAALGVALPTTPCTARPGERSALWLGPDEWLLVIAEGAAPAPWEGEAGAVFNISDRQVGWLIEGDGSEDALAVGCPLDLSAVPIGFCSRTVFGKAEVVLWRRDPHSFHLETWRSFAPYVAGLLAEGVRALA